jgi:hypothetical protein
MASKLPGVVVWGNSAVFRSGRWFGTYLGSLLPREFAASTFDLWHYGIMATEALYIERDVIGILE